MSTSRDYADDEDYDVEAHAVVVTLTMPFFDDIPWGEFCKVFGKTLVETAERGGAQMERHVGRGENHLTIVSSHKGMSPEEGGSVSFYASVKPLADAKEEASALYGISKKAGALSE